MQYKEEHEPELEDMDDYHKPMPKSKLRTIAVSLVVLVIVWGLFQAIYSLFLS